MADTRLRHHKCPECSATVEVGAEATQIRCAYCGTTLAVEHRRPPRDRTQTRAHTVYVPPVLPLGARIAIGIVPLVILASVGIGLWPLLRTAVPALAPGSTLPAECPINGKVVIEGKTWTGTGAAVRAGVNCTITIRDSKLEADEIVDGGVNVRIEIERSTLVARKRGITTGPNARVRLAGGSELRGHKAALDLGPNAEVRMDGSRVLSDGVALRAGANLSLDADGGELAGHPAVDAEGWTARYDVEGTKLTGEERVKRRR